MLVHRLCRAAHTALDGEGASLVGGRWNSPGRPAVYTSAHLSLAALEYLIHLEVHRAPPDLVALTIEIPDRPISTLRAEGLPPGWNRIADHPWCAAYGDAWIAERRSVSLRVPSAIIPEEQNLILNPAHPDFAQVTIVAERRFQFDPRLLT